MKSLKIGIGEGVDLGCGMKDSTSQCSVIRGNSYIVQCCVNGQQSLADSTT